MAVNLGVLERVVLGHERGLCDRGVEKENGPGGPEVRAVLEKMVKSRTEAATTTGRREGWGRLGQDGT